MIYVIMNFRFSTGILAIAAILSSSLTGCTLFGSSKKHKDVSDKNAAAARLTEGITQVSPDGKADRMPSTGSDKPVDGH